MLITNFSSGELSANLFGRIDLPQYHGGTARLENFDVIPTGGIKRRGGTERLKELEGGESRIIPVIISLDEIYLLMFTNRRITVFGKKAGEWNWNNPVKEFNNGHVNPETLYADEEISEVQYAQNQRLMVITHQNHPPLRIDFYTEDISVNIFQIKTTVERIFKEDADINVFDEDDAYEPDAEYEKNKWLQKTKDWPAAVTFFNGRIIFAGTENHPQRVFASKANDYGNFSSYKKFLTEQRECVIVRGTITASLDTIIIKDKEASLAFTKKITGYVVESSFYDPGTRILEISGGTIRVSRNSNIRPPLNDAELSDLERWKTQAGIQDNSYEIGRSRRYYNGKYTYYDPVFKMYVGITSVRVVVKSSAVTVEDAIPVSHDMARQLQSMTPQTALFYLIQEFQEWLDGLAVKYHGSGYSFTYEYKQSDYDGYRDALNDLYEKVIYFWKYQVRNKEFFGKTDEIYNEIKEYYSQGTDVYIPFYYSTPLIDRYPTPDCGFTFEIASGANDAIRWLAVNRGLIVGTEMAEWLIPPDVHATNARAVALSRHGSDRIQGVALGDATLFFKSGRKGLVEYYPNDNDHFRANNMALLAPQMLHESPAKEFDYSANPYAKLFITREDGTLVTLLYERMTGTFAWNRITAGGEGKIISCAVLPGEDGFDDLYLVVERKSGRGLERLREEETVFLDGWREWKFSSEAEKRKLVSGYGEGAVVYDAKENKVYKTDAPELELLPPSDNENKRYAGYPYKSVMKSMPVVKDGKMQAVSMTTMYVRLLDSFMPDIWNTGDGGIGNGPHNGVSKIVNHFSGQSPTLQFGIVHENPTRCRVLSVYAEV
jgi:hypothetical protein